MSSANEAAQLLAQGRLPPTAPIGELPEPLAPATWADAMRIQERFNAYLEATPLGRVVGTKIGCTTAVMQHYLGMDHPCSGAIFENTVQHEHGILSFDEFLHVGVECEIAVTLESPILARRAPHTMESVAESVGSFHAAIEIVDDRYLDFEARVPGWKTWVADNFFGAGAVLGPACRDWRSLNLAEVRGTMKIGGQEVGQGRGEDIINGHPLEALVWLANQEAEHNRDLSAAWIVLLGSVVQTKWVSAGDLVEIDIEGLGTAAAQFR